MKTIIKRFTDWWRRPPADERILRALSPDYWHSPLDICAAAQVSVWRFYRCVIDGERRGLVESKWDEGPIPASRHGRRRRLYKLRAFE